MTENGKVRVLFVCLGNICRSPTAEGIFRHLASERGLAERFHIDSAGTSAWHEGEPPDSRAQAEARRHGVELGNIRSRPVYPSDFEDFDYILAMDGENLRALRKRCPQEHAGKIHRHLDFAPGLGIQDVPDPYYGGPHGFENVFRAIETAAAGLLEHIEENDLKN